MSSLLKNTSLYTIGNILPQAAGFFLLPIYTRYLTPADYGIVSSMQVLSTMLTVFFTMAIDRSIYRLYFDFKTDKDRRDYLGTITLSLFFISCAVLLLLFVFKGAVGQIYESISFFPYYVYAILTAFFSVFTIVPKIYFQVNEKAGKFVFLSITQFLLSTGLVLWFIIGKKNGAVGMLEGRMIAAVIILPLFFYISYRTINFTFKKQIFKESLAFSLPMIPGLMMAWVLNLSDRIFIERYFNLHDVGIYSLGYKIAGLVLIIASAFYLAYNPVFYKLANSENQKQAKEMLFKYNNSYIVVVLFITFFIVLFSKEAIQLLLNSKYYESYKIVPIISFAYLISQTSALFNLMIYQNKKVMPLTIIGFIGAAINILLNFLLVPPFGAYGAGYATVISFAIIFILSWRYAKKCYFIPFNWKLLSSLLLIAVGVIYLFSTINLSNIFYMLILKTGFLLLALAVIYVFYFDRIKIIIKGQ